MGTTYTHLIELARIALTGVVLFEASIQLWHFIHRRDRAHLWIGMWALTAATVLATRVWQHIAHDADEAQWTIRFVVTSGLLIVPVTIGAVHAIAAPERTREFRIAMLACAVFIAIAAATDLVVRTTPIQRIDALGRTFWTGTPGYLAGSLLAYYVLGGGYSVCVIWKSRTYVDRTARAVLAIAGVVAVLLTVNDMLTARGTIQSLLLVDFGIAGLALSFSFAEVRRSSLAVGALEARGAQRGRFIEGVIEAQERERKRIARDLHDSTGQSLTSLLVRLTALEQKTAGSSTEGSVAELRGLAKEALEDVRRTARGLHPVALEDLGFEEAVRALAGEIARSFDMNIDVHMNGLGEDRRLPAGLELSLYRIAQEALTNAARHSEAKTVSVLVDRTDERVQLIVEDDGIGFTEGKTTGLGMLGMTERAALFGGELTIESSRGGGTAIYVTIPL